VKIQYISKRFSKDSMTLIDQANEIMERYREQGFDLTLRQLFYQFVSGGLIENSQKEYKRLGGVVNDARLAGLMDWDSIVDRTRFERKNSHWNNPKEILLSAAHAFRLDKWKDSVYCPCVWIEKDALIGVIEGVCSQNDVPYFACRGYVSQSEMWAASQRFQRQIDCGQKPVLIHLGDHDPSGIDMSRDIEDRIRVFLGYNRGVHFEVRRIALTIKQVEFYDPPPNPAKITDSRCESYVEKYGEESWELDALEPSVLIDLIQSEIDSVRSSRVWSEAVNKEEDYRGWLFDLAENHDSMFE
jgi:hypothetical protein